MADLLIGRVLNARDKNVTTKGARTIMLKFMRNKLIRVFQREPGKLIIHGILSDDIYELELQVELEVPDMKIASIEGMWHRWTTPECPRAIPFLQEAVGLGMGEDFSNKIKKIVGRKACRHYANLLLECCYTAREAAVHVLANKAQVISSQRSEDVYATRQDVAPKQPHKIEPLSREPAPNGEGARFVIDLHVHSSPASPCSSAPVDELIKEAKRIGLHSLCLTDHNYNWSRAEVDKLMENHDYLILRGNEITTDQGDMLVFGLEKEITGIVRLEELAEEVRRAKGFIIVAHPFRGFLTFGVGQLGLTPEQAMQRPMFKYVNAIEVLNSKVTRKENAFALQVAQGLGKPATGGSDAHEVEEVGIYATAFDSGIKGDEELVEALRDGAFKPVAYRKERGIT